jgi:Na+-transporting NADH:ubiquinone oxidoreductase subunit C
VGEAGPLRTVAVALAVCAVCSLVVTAAVVLLRPYQVENQRAERARKVTALVAGLPGVGDLVAAAGEGALELRVVELSSGGYAPDVDPEALAGEGGDAQACTPLPAARDPAGVGCLPRHAPVYELRQEGRVHTVILPVRGQGYLSMMRGFLAVAGDGRTVRGITFTEHEETPGLGAEITNPAWQARWKGKQLFGDEGAVRIRVVPEAPPPGAPDAAFRIQGISGATKTSQGVSELVRFWVGPDAFGPYLERIREEGGAA